MEPLVESFYEKDVEEELEEHFKKSQSETKTRKGKELFRKTVRVEEHLVGTGRFISIFAAAAL